MPEARFLTHADRAYRREKIIAVCQRGGSLRRAAERYGVSYTWAYQFVKQAGVSLPKRRRS